jgi:predicted enzyme involved in methoxymalonyl-ACP biosynthesis
MSCRVFSRTAEQFILRRLIEIAHGMGATRLLGEYLPTARNGIVADLFPRLGFTPADGAFFVRELGQGVGDLLTFIAP